MEQHDQLLTVAERIQYLRRHFSLSQKDFGIVVGVGRTTVVNWENGKTEPHLTTLRRIALATGINPAFLDPVLEVSRQEFTDFLKDVEPIKIDRPDDAFDMPVADLSEPLIPILSYGQAGEMGGEPVQLNLLPVEYSYALKGKDQYWAGDGEYWLPRSAEIKDLTAYGLKVRGDSMRPTYKPGQCVVASPIKPVFPGDEVVVKIIDDQVLIKEISYRDGKVILKSHNPDYEDIVLPKEKIQFAHKIVWVKK